MDPGRQLRELRLRKKMTQVQLAKELNVTEFTVCRYETGRIAMPPDTIRRAAEIFQVCPARFITDWDCRLSSDPDLLALFQRADRLDPENRRIVRETLGALLNSLARKPGN